jgi:hypothetical protein
MKKAKFFIFGFLLSSFIHAQVMWQIKKDTVVKWYYYDGDEFNGPLYDAEKWTPAFSWTNVNYDLNTLMIPERMVFDSGLCHFMCYRDTGLYPIPYWHIDSSFKKKFRDDLVNGNKFRYYYTAGNVWSKGKYSRGYFEIRFKANDEYGMWPTFWLFGDGKDEIDIFELKGERIKDIHVDMHCLKGCDSGYRGGSFFPKSFGGWVGSTQALNKGYNIISGEWQNGYVKYYLNGQGIAIFNGDIGSEKMSVIIGNSPAKDGSGFSPGVTKNTAFPNSYDVDYVRVWYKDSRSKNEVLGKKHTDFDCVKDEVEKKSFLKKKVNFMYSKKAFKNDLITISVLPKKNKKLLVTSLGKNVNYRVIFYDENGKEILNKNVLEHINEFDFSKLVKGNAIKIKIQAADKILEESLTLQ